MTRSVEEAGKKSMGLVPSPGHSVSLRGHVVPRISKPNLGGSYPRGEDFYEFQF